MSFVHGSVTRVYVNGFDLSAFLKNVSHSCEVGPHDSTTFSAMAKTYVPGLEDATLDAGGLFSGTAGATDAVMFAALRGRSPVTWSVLPQGDVDGVFGHGLLALQSSYEVATPADGLVEVTATAQSNVGLEQVQVLHPLTARVVTGTGIGRDSAVSTSTHAGGVGYLQVTTVSGVAPSLTARIQHSIDAVTWVDLITFAAVTSSNSAQRLVVAGTVNRHVRAQWTIAGTGPSFTFFAAFGRY
ncbi:MAG: hypothetical protein DDT20_01226 [Firmicutes bacterium]|nr:hypothetical protein [Bacillota bacterium]